MQNSTVVRSHERHLSNGISRDQLIHQIRATVPKDQRPSKWWDLPKEELIGFLLSDSQKDYQRTSEVRSYKKRDKKTNVT